MFKNMIYKFVKHFRYCPKKSRFFRTAQDENIGQFENLIMPFHIRWNSFYNSLSRIIERYSATVNALQTLATEENDAVSLGYCIKLKSLETLSNINI